MSPSSTPRVLTDTSSLPPPMSLLTVVMFRVSLSDKTILTGIKPSATTVALSRDSKISDFLTSIVKRVSFGKRFSYSGKLPSSFLTAADVFSL